MNNLTSPQRKRLYGVGILVLLIPVMTLGFPSVKGQNGGYLAMLRHDNDLGESTLGNVDPSSASMNRSVMCGRRLRATRCRIASVSEVD